MQNQTLARIEALLRTYQARMRDLVNAAPSDVQEELHSMVPLLESSGHSESDLHILDTKCGIVLPISLRGYLLASTVEQFLEWNEVIVDGNTLLDKWKAMLTDATLRSGNLIQVTSGPCGDPVCLDLQRPSANGEFPIVIIDHDGASGHWRDPHSARRYITAEFRDFLQLLEVVCEAQVFNYRSTMG